MSPTEVFLCYGIFVSGQSLIAATATWRKIVRTDALLDAIKHKRTKTGMKAIVYAVPPEIWDMVEQHLFDLERPVVVSDMVKEILCRDCITQLEDTQETLTFKHLNARLSYKFSKACESCKSSADQVRGLHDAVDLQACRQLLTRYELALPCMDHFDPGEGISPPIYPETYNLICLPSKTHEPNWYDLDFPDFKLYGAESCEDGPVVRELDVGLPSDATDRFEHAVHQLQLKPVWRRDWKIGCLVGAPEPDDGDADEFTPRWRLLMCAGGKGLW